MRLKYRTIILAIIAVVLTSLPVNSAVINMMCKDEFKTEISNTVTFAVEIEGLYYTVLVKDGVVNKVELDGEEEPEFIVRTDFNTAMELITNYNQMTWLDKVQFLVVRMEIPYDFITSMAQSGVMY